MNFIKKLFRLKSQRNSAEDPAREEARPKEVPVSRSSEFITHTETTTREFGFLISNYGFRLTKNEFVSREYWIVYSKGSIDVEIMFETGSLPFVTIRNNGLPYDESKGFENRDNVEYFNEVTRQIRQDRLKRRDPVQKRFMDEWLSKDKPDLTELDNDYEQFGKHEHIEYLRQAALTVRENLQLKKGQMKTYPKMQHTSYTWQTYCWTIRLNHDIQKLFTFRDANLCIGLW